MANKNKKNLPKKATGEKKDSKLRSAIIAVIVIALLSALLIYKIRSRNEKVEKLDETAKQLIIGKETLFAVYENKLALSIPFELNANKDETFGAIVKKKNTAELLDAVNKIMPEKLDTVKEINSGKVDFDYIKATKEVPVTTIDNKKYILTTTLQKLFNELYKDKTEIAAKADENLIVDVLNANGRTGYAKKTGEKLKNELSVKYNAANYESFLDESYVILNDISREKAQEVIMKLNEKYLKIRESSTVPTLANIVVILGKEEKIPFEINVSGKGETANTIVAALKKQGYKNVKTSQESKNADSSVIEYNPDDYFIAYKVSQYANIKNMVEKSELKNRINIIVK